MLCLRRFSEALQEQFPDSEALVRAGLATRKELQLLESEADLGRVWHVPISWAMIMIRRLPLLINSLIFGRGQVLNLIVGSVGLSSVQRSNLKLIIKATNCDNKRDKCNIAIHDKS